MKYMISFSGEKPRQEYSKLFDGVGLIRGEYPIRAFQKWITKPEMQRELSEYVNGIVEQFRGKEVWYRTIELPSSWINNLDGCEKKIENLNIAESMRGIRRALAFPNEFQIELDIISKLSQKYNNLNIILPFVSDVSEFIKAQEYIKSTTFRGKVGIMAEIPSTILCIKDFLRRDLDNFTIGLNDLTAATLSARRNMQIYDRNHPAIVKLMEYAIEKSYGSGVQKHVAGKHDRNTISTAEKLGFDAVTIFIQDIQNSLRDRVINGRNLLGEMIVKNPPKLITSGNGSLKIIED